MYTYCHETGVQQRAVVPQTDEWMNESINLINILPTLPPVSSNSGTSAQVTGTRLVGLGSGEVAGRVVAVGLRAFWTCSGSRIPSLESGSVKIKKKNFG